MAGKLGVDYFQGDHPEGTIRQCRELAEDYRTGKRTPTHADIDLSRMKLRDGKYPYYEEELANAIMAAAHSCGIIR